MSLHLEYWKNSEKPSKKKKKKKGIFILKESYPEQKYEISKNIPWQPDSKKEK